MLTRKLKLDLKLNEHRKCDFTLASSYVNNIQLQILLNAPGKRFMYGLLLSVTT